jgi:segregation and condensation protein B
MSDDMHDDTRDETAEALPDEAAAGTPLAESAESEAAADEAAPVDAVTDPSPEATPDAGAPEAVTPDADPSVGDAADAPAAEGEPAAPRPSMDGGQLEAIVEALVFASPEPLTPKMLFKLLADEPKEDVQAALDRLVVRYEHPGGLHLAQVAGGYQITTRPELHEWVRRLFHERNTQKLSVAALETLSVIAYRQPVTAAEVNEIRAVNASGVLSTLLERHLIKIVGRKNVVGRPFLYGTTKEFLIRFGLKDLNDLPNMQDMVQALGFDPPALLMERPVTDEMLPLEEGDVPTASPGAEED